MIKTLKEILPEIRRRYLGTYIFSNKKAAPRIAVYANDKTYFFSLPLDTEISVERIKRCSKCTTKK